MNLWLALVAYFFWPTAILYGLVAFCLYRYVKKKELLMLIVAVAPLVFWGYAYVETYAARARLDRIAAAAETSSPPQILPDTIVFSGTSAPPVRDIKRLGIFKYLVVKREPRRSRPAEYRRYDLSAVRTVREPGSPVSGPYIELRSDAQSQFRHDPRTGLRVRGSPLELRFVDGSQDVLIGLRYRSYVAYPIFPPVLSTIGWYRKRGPRRHEVAEFIKERLAGSRPMAQN
jgi:hypothetical protein